jgi:hypothetical protein
MGSSPSEIGSDRLEQLVVMVLQAVDRRLQDVTQELRSEVATARSECEDVAVLLLRTRDELDQARALIAEQRDLIDALGRRKLVQATAALPIVSAQPSPVGIAAQEFAPMAVDHQAIDIAELTELLARQLNAQIAD